MVGVLHVVEGLALVVLCSCRPATRRLAVNVLKEVRALHNALGIAKVTAAMTTKSILVSVFLMTWNRNNVFLTLFQGDEELAVDVMDRVSASVLESFIHLTGADQVGNMCARKHAHTRTRTHASSIRFLHMILHSVYNFLLVISCKSTMVPHVLFFSSLCVKTSLLYCPSGTDLQTLTEWSSSPISHQFDVVSPSHIWVFAHVTQGQDPWVISLSSYLRQENLPKHCPTALSYAWHFASTRLQLLSPQVDIK